jgi:hypothetical protein
MSDQPHCAGGGFQTAQGEGDDNMTELTVPMEVFDAIGVILDEFGNTDLEPRLRYYAYEHDHDPEEGRELGRQLLRAFDLVSAWRILPMNPSDIRHSFENSDHKWELWIEESDAA